MSAHRLSLGTAQLGAAYGIANQDGMPSAEEGDAILELALESGIRHIDTAPVYGESETRIGRFFRARGVADSFEVCTKLGGLGDARTSREVSKAVDRSIEASLDKLAIPILSEVLIHGTEDLYRHGRALVDALLVARERGGLEKIGVSVYAPEELSVLNEFPELEVVQLPLSVFDQRLLHSGWLGRLRASGRIVQARSVFLQGLIALPEDALPKKVAHARDALRKYLAMLSDRELSAQEAALLFAINIDVDRIVIGTETAAQLRKNIEAMSKSMPEALFQEIRTAFRDLPERIIDPRQWR